MTGHAGERDEGLGLRADGASRASDFEAAYEAWRAAQFPKGSRSDSVDDAKGELAYWDAMLAEVLVPFAGGRAFNSGVLDFPAGFAGLRDRLNHLRENAGEDSSRVSEYIGYLGLMEDAFAAGRQAARSST